MTTSRISWDVMWRKMADVVAMRSRCDGTQVGALLVDSSNRLVSTGYNGPPSSFDTSSGITCSSWCNRQKLRMSENQLKDSPAANPSLSYGLACPSIHAEANALMFADRRDYVGGTIFITAAICQDCTKLVANSGVARVVMRVRPEDAHRDPQFSINFLKSCGLTVDIVDPA